MSDKNPYSDRKPNPEEEYFIKKEKELIEKIRERSAVEAKRQALYDAVGVTDPQIIADLQELGYTRDTLGLLHLLPIVRVAWAEGKITQAERELIFEAARVREVVPGTPGYEKLTDWLNRRPTEQFFEKSMRVIQAVLMVLPKQEVEGGKQDLLSYCIRVAEASGGILGLGRKIDGKERAVIEQVAKMLEQSRKSAAKEVLDQQ